MRLPFLDLAAGHAELAEQIEDAVCTTLRRGWYITGEQLEAFEEEFARYIGVRHLSLIHI